jgi:uncharacterized protein (TIGR03067 family)
MRPLTCLALGFALTSVSALTADPPRPDDPLAGTWALTEIETNGNRITLDDPPARPRFRLAGDKLLLETPGGKQEFGIKFERSTAPMLIDLISPDGTKKGQVTEGIWKVEGDTFTACFSPAGIHERPTEFKAPAGTGLLLVILKREKP